MCGIFGFLLNRPLTPADIAAGKAATKALAHRGPDGAGEWLDREAGVYFGHRRLAIIDLGDGGCQPKEVDGSVITYNGELYNYRELRERLRGQGVPFVSDSDTEVVLRALRHWGEDALDLFDGMFAFALWDGGQAMLATDPFGEKPLYYAQTPNGFYFSSEIGPLARLLESRRRMPKEGWPAYLSLGYIPTPETAYSGIRRLPPATRLTVSEGRAVDQRTYWSPPLGEPGRGAAREIPEAGLDRIAGVLTESLERRLVADVPVALFLSAGIDSTLVAALSSRNLGAQIPCITVAHSVGDVTNEAPAARAIADRLGLDHVVLENDVRPEWSTPDQILDVMGQLNANYGLLPFLQISRLAAQSYKAALTGMGGDEISWGYGKNSLYWRWRSLFRLPDAVRAGVLSACRLLPRRARRFGLRIGPSRRDVYIANKVFPAFGWIRSVPGFEPWAHRRYGPGSRRGGLPVEIAVPMLDLEGNMADFQLTAMDHASMRASLELRTPFLSRALAETMAEFDPRALLAFGQKSVLRRLLARYLPRDLTDRPKSGFGYPSEYLLDGAALPQRDIAGLPADLARAAWNRRHEGEGWQLLAVRLLIAARFFGEGERDRPAPASERGATPPAHGKVLP